MSLARLAGSGARAGRRRRWSDLHHRLQHRHALDQQADQRVAAWRARLPAGRHRPCVKVRSSGASPRPREQRLTVDPAGHAQLAYQLDALLHGGPGPKGSSVARSAGRTPSAAPGQQQPGQQRLAVTLQGLAVVVEDGTLSGREQGQLPELSDSAWPPCHTPAGSS